MISYGNCGHVDDACSCQIVCVDDACSHRIVGKLMMYVHVKFYVCW